MAKRIDFKHVRTNADFGAVLAHYGIELHKDGSKDGQFKGLCPFHDDSKPSLKVNLDRRLYNCFACGASGNVLEFVAEHDGLELRAAAEKVAGICGIALTPGGKEIPSAPSSNAPRPQAKPETPADETLEELPTSNAPLSFELKLTQDDELTAWLSDRGITPEHAQTFGLGRASKRSKTIGDRLAIPLHNVGGELVGYCGRYLGDADADDVPKYILPKGFRKELELFNQHRVAATSETELPYLMVFESYLSVMRFPALHAVSPFGRAISPEQCAAIAALAPKRILVVFDGDEPGYNGARDVAGQLAAVTWTQVVDLPDGTKPHHYSEDRLLELLRQAW